MSSDSDTREKQAARKCLIRQARLFPKKTHIWIQGVIVWKGQNQIAVDDGSGIARIDVSPALKRDSAFDMDDLQVGGFVLAVGEMAGKYKGHRLGMRGSTIRDLTKHEAMTEAMWNLEVVDGYLQETEKRREHE